MHIEDEVIPVHSAAEHGDMDQLVRLIRESPFQVHRRGKSGRLPLHRAAFGGHPEIVSFLLDHGAQVDATTELRQSALHDACNGGNSACVVRILLARGANVNAPGKFEFTPLHLNCFVGGPEITEFLLAHGADVYARNFAGESPLHFAATMGHKNIAELLLQSGAKVNVKNRLGETPLKLALRKITGEQPFWKQRREETAVYLKSYGAS